MTELQQDPSPGDWIIERLWPPTRDDGFRIGSLVPDGYETYVRILHRFEEHLDGHNVRVRWSELAERTGRTMHPLIEFTRFGIDYSASMRGSLVPEEVPPLAAALARFTSTPNECWFGKWYGYGTHGTPLVLIPDGRIRGAIARWAMRRRGRRAGREANEREGPTFGHRDRLYYLYRGPLEAVNGFMEFPAIQSPNYWWPDDRAWLVATEIDFDSTVVACSRACADALLEHDDLECVEVGIDGRLDIEGDTVNPRRPGDVDFG